MTLAEELMRCPKLVQSQEAKRIELARDMYRRGTTRKAIAKYFGIGHKKAAEWVSGAKEVPTFGEWLEERGR